jgi:hypothetical protein
MPSLLRFLEWQFPHCLFRWYPDSHSGLTLYPDGTTLPAAPEPTPAYRHTARALGYGRHTARMCREHELAHHWLAALAGTRSETLWLVAHGECSESNLELRIEEEARVMAFQRAVNEGQHREFRAWCRVRV